MKNNRLHKFYFLIVLIICVLAGYYANSYRGKTAREWANLAAKNQDNAVTWKEMYFKSTSLLKDLQITPTPTLIVKPTDTSTKKSATVLKTIKGMNCRPINNDGSTDCTDYEYQFNPNPTLKQADTLPANMLQ